MNIIDINLKFLKWMLIIAPPLMVATFILLPLYDRAEPWSVGESELKLHYPDGIPLCVGLSSSYSGSSGSVESNYQRSYLILNKRVLVTVNDSTENGMSTVSTDTSQWGFWIIQLLFAGLIWISVRFSIPKITSKFKQKN